MSRDSSLAPHPLIVRLREGAAAGPLWAEFLGPGAHVRHTLSGFHCIAVAAPADSLSALDSHADVERRWPDLEVSAAIDGCVPAASVPALWEEGLTGKGVRLGVLDTGIDRGHPDFEGRIAAFEDFTGRGVRDDMGHGTFVASVAAGSGEASRGRYRGVAPAASLLVARVLDGEGRGRVSDVMAGMNWAMAREMHVLNLSLRAQAGAGDGALEWAVKEVTARGILVCAAASDGSNEAEVAAAAGSSAVRCAAPAGAITAARAYGTTIGIPAGEQYVQSSGASAASALVSGVCALLLEAEPQAGAAEVLKALAASSRGPAGGAIFVNALAALAELREAVRRG